MDKGNPVLGIPSDRKDRKPLEIKVYLVFLRTNVNSKKQPHERLLGAKLSKEGAQKIADANPGAYIHKVFVTKF